MNYVRDIAADGGKILFVGTKSRHRIQSVTKLSVQASLYQQRWLGELLQTLQRSVSVLPP
ncbi:hypothetical protein [Sinobaca sp. H24]|uniref:hypothetical protein n=1 Tax=Sinobaca sp. H24 TaxID=2923376 RepID=UPI0035B2FAE7